MAKQECAGWPGATLVARLPALPRPARRTERRERGKSTLRNISRLVLLKQHIQNRLNEVARALRAPPPSLRLDHHGQASIDEKPVSLDLGRVEALMQRSPPPRVCALTLLRASLAALIEPILPRELLGRLWRSSGGGRLAHAADFLAGYTLAAFRATLETRRAFLREVAPLPDDDSPLYHDRLRAFEQGLLAFPSPA